MLSKIPIFGAGCNTEAKKYLLKIYLKIDTVETSYWAP